jgi:hypothetical protein
VLQGVYSLLTIYLSEILDSAFFRVTSCIFTILVFMLWATLATMTIYDLFKHREQLLNAPCIPDNRVPSERAESYQSENQTSTVVC